MQAQITQIIADYFQALGHPVRIEILELLKDKNEMCVCEIVEKLKKDQSNISRHLNALKTSGILELRNEGVKSIYKVKDKDVYRILVTVRDFLQREIKENQKILAAF